MIRTPTPYFHYELFELNDSINVTTKTIEGLGDIVIIDDFYKHPDDIHLFLRDQWVQAWKSGPNSVNFKEYYDCRLSFQHNVNNHPRECESQRLIWDLTARKLGYIPQKIFQPYNFNYFRWINPPQSKDIQSYPHQDDDNMIASVIYLNRDEDTNGGTAFYAETEVNPEVGVMEQDDLRVDISKNYTLLDVVPAKFNRCVIYPGWFMHGAYIEDHTFYMQDDSIDRWRINQVYFFKLIGNSDLRTFTARY